jgi:pyrroline-5-carboxylate reductase
MGSAILSGVLEAYVKTQSTGAEPRIAKFIPCVNSEGSAERLRTRFRKYEDHLTIVMKDNVKGMKDADVVMLGCKPYMVEDVLGQSGVKEALAGKLLISFLAGTPLDKIMTCIYGAEIPKSHCHPVRAMMNIAAEFGESMTVIEEAPLPGDFSDITNWIFSQLGKISPIAPNLFDVGGVVAAPSMVFMSVALDGMLDAAVQQGIKRVEGRKLLAQSLVGLARLLENGDTPDTLREKFSSPRGTTIEGLMSLEEDRVRYAFCQAVLKSTKRSQEM